MFLWEHFAHSTVSLIARCLGVFLQEHFFSFVLRSEVIFCKQSVPARTLDLFCTQFIGLHSTSLLHFISEAQYAASGSASPHN